MSWTSPTCPSPDGSPHRRYVPSTLNGSTHSAAVSTSSTVRSRDAPSTRRPSPRLADTGLADVRLHCWSGHRRRCAPRLAPPVAECSRRDRKSTRLNSSHSQISYAVFCLKKKKKNKYVVTMFEII